MHLVWHYNLITDLFTAIILTCLDPEFDVFISNCYKFVGVIRVPLYHKNFTLVRSEIQQHCRTSVILMHADLEVLDLPIGNRLKPWPGYSLTEK